MIIADHLIFTTYGTWLPNDPRGSYSKEIYNEELQAAGDIQYGRQDPQPARDVQRRFWVAAIPLLKRRPYFINNQTRGIIANGFEKLVQRFEVVVYACAIMNDHVHLVVRRAARSPQYLIGQFKAAATRELGLKETPWARYGWTVFLYDEEALVAAVNYVNRNPVLAGWGQQQWSFVTPP